VKQFAWFPTKIFPTGKLVWLVWIETMSWQEFMESTLNSTMIEMMEHYNDPNFDIEKHLQSSLGVTPKYD
jgi:hypothetical protein